jgi:hypothetical protein
MGGIGILSNKVVEVIIGRCRLAAIDLDAAACDALVGNIQTLEEGKPP